MYAARGNPYCKLFAPFISTSCQKGACAVPLEPAKCSCLNRRSQEIKQNFYLWNAPKECAVYMQGLMPRAPSLQAARALMRDTPVGSPQDGARIGIYPPELEAAPRQVGAPCSPFLLSYFDSHVNFLSDAVGMVFSHTIKTPPTLSIWQGL